MLAAVGVLLAAPSIWFFAKVPLLWRDLDAYLQATGAVDPAIVLLHGPLYSFLARFPLFVGHVVESVGSNVGALGEFLHQPSLTDSGVFLLVLLQHAALLTVQFYFVATLTATVDSHFAGDCSGGEPNALCLRALRRIGGA